MTELLPPLTRLGFGHRLPVLLQSEQTECGLVCLAMVAARHGARHDLASLRSRLGTSAHGSNLAELMRQARVLGLETRAVRAEVEHLRDLRMPAILHWDLNHFVVLAGRRGRRLIIHDPAEGRRVMEPIEVSRHFTGIALELQPATDFVSTRSERPVRLREIIGPLPPGSLATGLRIFALALALEVFAIAAPLFMQTVVDQVLLSHDRDLLWVLALGFGLLVIIQSAFGYVRSRVVLALGTLLNLQLGARLFQRLLRLPHAFFARRSLGDLASRFDSVSAIQRDLTTAFLEGFVDGLVALGTLAVMLFYSPTLSAVVVLAGLLYAALRVGMLGQVKRTAQARILTAARQDSHTLETLRAMQTIKLMQAEDLREDRWRNLAVETAGAAARAQHAGILQRHLNTLLFGLENIIVVFLGARLVMEGGFSVGMLLAFVAYKSTFVSRFAEGVEKGVDLRALSIHAQRLADVVHTEPEPRRMPTARDATAPAGFDGSIELRDVSFAYGPADAPILRKVSLRIEPGESVALVGPSGTGKTTLVRLLLGLLTPDSGEILIGGQTLTPQTHDRAGQPSAGVLPVSPDMQPLQAACTLAGASGMALPDPRRWVGTVMQDDQLLAGSIAENVSFFDPQPDAQRLQACAALAAIDADIAALPMGWHTPIGDMGAALSGGQKQRLLLARALYRQPRILVLDEATSHLDTAREREVNAAVRGLALTRLIVAHRPDTIASADRIIELRDGQIEEISLGRLTTLRRPSSGEAMPTDPSLVASGAHIAAAHPLVQASMPGSSALPVVTMPSG